MLKFKWLIFLFFLVVIALAVSLYFWREDLKLSNGFQTAIDNVKTINVDSIVSQIQKQVITAVPLNIGGQSNNVTLLKSKIIEETNSQRVANGLAVMTENLKLNQAAETKANDMFLNQYFEHVSPSGIDPGTLVANSGYEYIITGENLILGNFEDEADMVEAWMNSPGHRANILNATYSEIGVAVIKGDYKGEQVWIAVQEFGLPLSACQKPNESQKVKIENDKIILDELAIVLDDKKKQIENINQTAYYNQLFDDYNEMVKAYNLKAENLKLLVADYNDQVKVFNDCVKGAKD
ncbi:MAG: CAP domain-containing protein [Candidatus Pacebacteria bacterium]|nr:CAP domain-containing protein [Candidatus Paceibacterota bacterium]